MKSGLFLLFVTLSATVFAQADYKIGIKNKDGYSSIYTTITTAAASVYSNSTSVTRYGLLEEKSKKVILPIKYEMVYTSYEDDLYIVEDTLKRFGLFSAKNEKFLIDPVYNNIDVFSEGLAIVQKKTGSGFNYEYYYGAVDKTGKLVIADTFVFLSNCRDGLLNFKQDKKFGFIDRYSKIIIPAMYANAGNFANGLAPVQLSANTKYGYINKENKFVIEPQYEEAKSFYEGYANVYTAKKTYDRNNNNNSVDKIGLIDTKGNNIIDPVYQSISLKKTGGIFKVSKDGKEGLTDSTGKIILPADNKKIDEFYYGNARVEKTTGMYGLINTKGNFLLTADYNEISMLYSGSGYYAKKDSRYQVFDKNLKVIIAADTAKRVVISKTNIAFVFNNAVKVFDVGGKYIKNITQENVDIYGTSFFSNDDSLKVPYFKAISLYNLQTKVKQKLIVTDVTDFNDEGIFLAKDSKYSFYDYSGKKLYEKSFENVINFSEGICGLQETSYSKPYLADKSLNKITELTTVFYGPYSEGLAMCKAQYGGTIYYLNKQGREQFYVYATEGGACKNGRIKIKNAAGKFLFVDKNGKIFNSNTYDDLGDYYDGLSGFKENKKCGYIDTAGNIAIAAQFDEVSNFNNAVAIVKQNNEFFLIDKKGKAINNIKYTAASNPANGTFPVKKGNNFGLIDNTGKTIADFKYAAISPIYEGMVYAKMGEKWALLNAKGAAITTFEFDGYYNFENGYSKAYKNKKLGLIDKTGKLVLPIEYTQISKVYSNSVITVKPNGTAVYPVK
ncbi:MAG: hypothetical protein RIR31_352 [Bacteroidota bacterium]